MWRFGLAYYFVFGAFVAMALWLPKYYVGEYGLPLATAAFLTILFDLPSGAIRALGGWASDKWGGSTVTWWVLWVSLICMILLSYPPTTMIVHAIKGDVAVDIGVGLTMFTVLIFIVGLAQGFGKASVYRSLADHYPTSMGVVGGIVGVIGGLGGFTLPIMFGVAADVIGVRSSCFMLMTGVIIVTMIWTWVAERNEREGILADHADARAALAGADLIERTRRRRHLLVDWRPDDETFWATTGRRIANRNLWLSMPALLLAFAVWVVWSVIVVELPHIGFKFTTNQLFWLAALPGLSGAVFRALYSFVVPIFGGRNFTGVEHDDAAAAHALDRLRRAGPDHQLRGVRGDRAAVRPGRGQLLVVDGAHQLPVPEAAARDGARRECGCGQPGRGPRATDRADRDVRRRAAGPGRQGADARNRRGGHADVGAERRVHLGAADRAVGAFRVVRHGQHRQRARRLRGAGRDPEEPAPVADELAVHGNLRFVHRPCGRIPDAAEHAVSGDGRAQVRVDPPGGGALVRPLGGWLADRMGGAKITVWIFGVMTVAPLVAAYCLPGAGGGGNLTGFVLAFLAMFVAAGLGNGSTFRMIPIIFRTLREREVKNPGDAAAMAEARRIGTAEGAATLGFSSAVAALGAFYIPVAYGASFGATGSAFVALLCFAVFYASCVLGTWQWYARRGAEVAC